MVRIEEIVDNAKDFLPDRSNGHASANPSEKRQASSNQKLVSSIREVPVTYERQPYYAGANDVLQHPGTARANIAPSKESPEGTDGWAQDHQHQTVMQQHCVYFDQDGDGVIWPFDTYRATRAWGWNPILALLVMVIIHPNLSYPTSPSWIPDPFFRIWIHNIHKDKHGSDSMSYDSEGRFRPQQFEDMFAKYDRGNKGGLSISDLLRFHKGQRFAMDFWGWSASFLEWLATYLLLWPEDGVMQKEEVRMVFDGSIFQYKADEYAKKRERKRADKRLF
ncbi:Putative EF-hand domain pair protein [Septoria linicola]|uniref:EF-hand domain pair protein n=1 Tax=Septoria linicola TaxID=215465 RepID=A0A9Q9EL37_9PEZI|nr:putative EF-hand domain pair protein [Septoria linicola]USW55411.1 Putative EF-hand domain pair protein [Septoria linicola]